MTTVNIKILETFCFDGKAHPYNLLGHWGCAFSLCPKGQRVSKGDMAHKMECDGEVDLIHPNCFVDMKKELKKQSIQFTVEDLTVPKSEDPGAGKSGVRES